MKEFYTFEGQSYEVDPSRLEEFLGQFPNATKVDGLGKTTDPASESMDSGSESGSSVLLDRIETGDFGEEPKDEVGQLKQIPGYYDQERITPDPNVGYFPTDIGMSSDFLIRDQGVDQRFKDQALMQPTDQITNQVAEFYTTQENQQANIKAQGDSQAETWCGLTNLICWVETLQMLLKICLACCVLKVFGTSQTTY